VAVLTLSISNRSNAGFVLEIKATKGGGDWLQKPFGNRALLARLEALAVDSRFVPEHRLMNRPLDENSCLGDRYLGRPRESCHALRVKKRRDRMIDHTGIGVADVARSAAFYDAALGALGLRRVMQLPAKDGADAVGYGVDYPVFWIDRFHPHSVKQHTAFVARSREAVDGFCAASLKAGGIDNGSPGLRDTANGYPPGYYATFVLDPDGNNIEAVFRES
jgi:catechol 2,3-dioxygenase-like lactoylglutathione lyase family enzyme